MSCALLGDSLSPFVAPFVAEEAVGVIARIKRMHASVWAICCSLRSQGLEVMAADAFRMFQRSDKLGGSWVERFVVSWTMLLAKRHPSSSRFRRLFPRFLAATWIR